MLSPLATGRQGFHPVRAGHAERLQAGTRHQEGWARPQAEAAGHQGPGLPAPPSAAPSPHLFETRMVWSVSGLTAACSASARDGARTDC